MPHQSSGFDPDHSPAGRAPDRFGYFLVAAIALVAGLMLGQCTETHSHEKSRAQWPEPAHPRSIDH